MPPADEDSPEIKVVGGADGRPRRPVSDQHSFNLLAAVTALVAIIALLFGLAWGFGWGHSRTRKVVLSAGSADVKQMSSVARTFVTSFTNYDPDGIDRIYNQVNSIATGDFQKEWPQLLPSNVRQQIRTNRAQIRGEVKDFFVQGFDGTSGEVYAVSDVTYANSSQPQPIPDTLRFDIHLVKTNGAWKINQVDLLNSPSATAGLNPSSGSGSSASTTTSTIPN